MNRPIRILTATTVAIAIGAVSANDIVKQNSIDYQQHPTASVIGGITPAFIVGLALYFWWGWIAGRKKSRSEKESSTPVMNDRLYDLVAAELQNKVLIPGLWTKAYSEMNGDSDKARALYIKLRVAQLAGVNKPEASQPEVKAELGSRSEQTDQVTLLQNQIFLTLLTIASGLLTFLFALPAIFLVGTDFSAVAVFLILAAVLFGIFTFGGLRKLKW